MPYRTWSWPGSKPGPATSWRTPWQLYHPRTLTDEEIEQLKAGAQAKPGSATKSEDEPKDTTEGEDQEKAQEPSPELVMKASKALSPKLVLFLGELVKAAMVPDPDC